ncbi:MAG: EcsC family protein [Evtepia sp.]
MLYDILKEMDAVKKEEQKFLTMPVRQSGVRDSIYEKVPEKLCTVLETAFSKAFELVFLHGKQLIEKTYSKEELKMEFAASNFVIDEAQTRKSFQRMDRGAQKKNFANHTFTSISGLGMGFLGFGIPDIPVLVATVLRGVYEIALSYGFAYDTAKEQIYILRLIRTALAEGEERLECNRLLDLEEETTVKAEIAKTAKLLSDALLVEKFVQGIPIVGMVGGFVNHSVYRKISKLARLKYKKRYLYKKKAELKRA